MMRRWRVCVLMVTVGLMLAAGAAGAQDVDTAPYFLADGSLDFERITADVAANVVDPVALTDALVTQVPEQAEAIVLAIAAGNPDVLEEVVAAGCRACLERAPVIAAAAARAYPERAGAVADAAGRAAPGQAAAITGAVESALFDSDIKTAGVQGKEGKSQDYDPREAEQEASRPR